jgi:hypothetical protein
VKIRGWIQEIRGEGPEKSKNLENSEISNRFSYFFRKNTLEIA